MKIYTVMSSVQACLESNYSQGSVFSKEKISQNLAPYVFKIAAYMTDPICKAHEFYINISVVDILHSSAYRVTNYVRKLLLIVGIVGFVFLAALTTLPGIALRYIGIHLQKKPYIHLRGELPEIPFTGNKVTHLSWNTMDVPGGFCYTDAGLLPWPFRIDKTITEVQKQNPDVACFYELFDANAAFYLYEKLKKDYAHFYFNIGPRTIGVNSGIFVASKFKVEDPEFIAFPKEMLVGTTKFAEKGLFSFCVQHEKKPVYFLSTHLQHSEECAFATKEEKNARKLEMELIQKKVDQVKNKGLVILAGDMNCDDREFDASIWKNNKRVRFIDSKTWGGDKICADIVKKKISGPLNLDYTCLAEGPHQALIETTLIRTGFCGTEFRKEALSDHEGLCSTIVIT